MSGFKMDGLDFVADLLNQARVKREIEMEDAAKSSEKNPTLEALHEAADIPVSINVNRVSGGTISVSIMGSPVSIQVGAIAVVEGVFRTFRDHASKDPVFATAMALAFAQAVSQRAAEEAAKMRKEFMNE